MYLITKKVIILKSPRKCFVKNNALKIWLIYLCMHGLRKRNSTLEEQYDVEGFHDWLKSMLFMMIG